MMLLLNWNCRCSCFSESRTKRSSDSASTARSEICYLFKYLHYAAIGSNLVSKCETRIHHDIASGSRRI